MGYTHYFKWDQRMIDDEKLEFEPPLCPICDARMVYRDGQWHCEHEEEHAAEDEETAPPYKYVG